jgi:hypothetical protein
MVEIRLKRVWVSGQWLVSQSADNKQVIVRFVSTDTVFGIARLPSRANLLDYRQLFLLATMI